jgi:antitoxin component YwqK of YwqJK toxin-antitoxin module
MKNLLCFLFFISTYASAQKIPDYGFDRVRITEADRTITLETVSVKGKLNTSPDRMYFWYSANQIQTTQGGYSGKLLNGPYRSYYLNKNLMEEGTFNKGLKDGVWKNWKENGTLISIINWQDGLMSGNFSKYNENGNLIMSGSYKNGLLNGAVRNKGAKDSVMTTWYKNGVITEHRPVWKRIHLFHKKGGKQPVLPNP